VHGEAHDPIALDQHCTVVPGRVGVEQGEQQRLRELGVQLHAAFQMALQRLAARQHQQSATARLDQARDAADHDVQRRLRRGWRTAPQAPYADLLHQAPQVVLEHHHQHDDEDGEEGAQQAGGQRELEAQGRQVDQAQDREAHQGQGRAGAAQHDDGEPEQEGHQPHVHRIEDPDIRERFHAGEP
jgi:hypothetical protein